MVAPKRGRGAKGQAAKTRATNQTSDDAPVEQAEMSENVAEAGDDNGDVAEQTADDGGSGDAGDESIAEGGEGDAAETAEASAEDKKEDKVESGKILIENLPSSYLFDYQEKLRELFSKHGEVTGVK